MSWNPPRFDRHQFASRRAKVVSARYTPAGWDSTGISFADYKGGMHVHSRRAVRERRLETPSWAVNNAALREAILRFCERRFYIRPWRKLTEPSPLTDSERLANIRKKELSFIQKSLEPSLRRLIERQRTEKNAKLDTQIQNIDTQIRMYRRGIAGIAAGVVNLYHRCGYTSVEVAEEMDLHPPLVRQLLERIDHAHHGYCYICPKHQRAAEFRAEQARQESLSRGAARVGLIQNISQ